MGNGADSGSQRTPLVDLEGLIEAGNYKGFLSLLTKYRESTQKELSRISEAKKASERRLQGNFVYNKAEDHKDEDEKRTYLRLAQNTVSLASRLDPEVAVKYWQLFFARKDFFGRESLDSNPIFFLDRIVKNADDVMTTLLLLPQEMKSEFFERFYKVLHAVPNLSLMPLISRRQLPESTQIFLYLAGEKMPGPEDAFNGLNFPQFLAELGKLSSSYRLDAKRMFLEMLLQYDSNFGEFYDSYREKVSNASKEGFFSGMRNTFPMYKKSKGFLDAAAELQPLLGISKSALQGNLDSLVVYYCFGVDSEFRKKHEEYVEDHSIALKALSYLMIFTGKTGPDIARSMLERISFIEGTKVTLKDESVPLYEIVNRAVSGRKRYISEQVLEAVLEENIDKIAGLLSPKEEPKREIVHVPLQNLPNPEEEAYKELISYALKEGVVFYAPTIELAEKEANRINFEEEIKVASSEMRLKVKGETRKIPTSPTLVLNRHWGLYIINQQPTDNGDETVLLVSEIMNSQNGNKLNFLLVGNESLKLSLQQLPELIDCVPNASIYLYNTENCYINERSIKLEEMLRRAEKVSVF